MASLIVTAKNQTGSAIFLPRLGLTVPASPATITLTNFAVFAEINAEAALQAPVTSGDIIINDGSSDLSAAAGIIYINFGIGGGGGGGEDLAATLVLGNTTGGTDIVESSGDEIRGVDRTAASALDGTALLLRGGLGDPSSGALATGSFTVVSAPLTTALLALISLNYPQLVGFAGARTSGSNNFDKSLGTTALIAADIAAAINDTANAFRGRISASVAGSTVTITANRKGTLANAYITTVQSVVPGGGITAAAATLLGGLTPNFDGSTVTTVNPYGSLQANTGGNARGFNAVDLQASRIVATQVASGNNSVIGGGQRNTASGRYSSVAGGENNLASGHYAHIGGGQDNIASGQFSTVVGGQQNQATQYRATVLGGRYNVASGYSASAQGTGTTASGYASHAEGRGTIASYYYAHAEGQNTTASYYAAHAEGRSTLASGPYSHAEGRGGIAAGDQSHAEGRNTSASGNGSHAEGDTTTASGIYAHAEGESTVASGAYSHAQNRLSRATVAEATAIGLRSLADRFGQIAFSTGPATGTNVGTTQGSIFTAQIQTTNATPTELRVGTTSHLDRMILRASTTWTFSLWVTARQTAGAAGTVGDSAGFKAEGVIKRDGAGVTTLVAAVVTTLIAADAAAATWTAVVTADNTNESLLITVTGEASKTIRWESVVIVTESGLGIA